MHGRHMRLHHLMSNVRYRFTLGSESHLTTVSWLSPPGCLGLHVWAATLPAGELKSHIPGHSQPSLAQRILPVWVLLFKLCKLFTSIRYIISMWFLPIGFAWGCEAQGWLRLWLAEIVADRGHQRQWHTKTKVEKQQHAHKVKHAKKAEGTKLLKLGRGIKKLAEYRLRLMGDSEVWGALAWLHGFGLWSRHISHASIQKYKRKQIKCNAGAPIGWFSGLRFAACKRSRAFTIVSKFALYCWLAYLLGK